MGIDPQARLHADWSTSQTSREFSLDEKSGAAPLREASFEPYTPCRYHLVLTPYLGPPGWVLVCGCILGSLPRSFRVLSTPRSILPVSRSVTSRSPWPVTSCLYLWQVASPDCHVQETTTASRTSATGPPRSSFSIAIPRGARRWKGERSTAPITQRRGTESPPKSQVTERGEGNNHRSLAPPSAFI